MHQKLPYAESKHCDLKVNSIFCHCIVNVVIIWKCLEAQQVSEVFLLIVMCIQFPLKARFFPSSEKGGIVPFFHQGFFSVQDHCK
uniref:Uncharacterized protein n=1 Tax=Anguilla anguilla TaxID=7936 RepID=A0A0E9WYZ8_ANGAN